MFTESFHVLPQHRKRIVDLLKLIYKIEISEDEVDKVQDEEPFVNFSHRQGELLRRMIVFRKTCNPILEYINQAAKPIQKNFNLSFMNQYLAEAQRCFFNGQYLASIILCRSSLEIGLREAIAHVESTKKSTTFLKVYIKFEKKTLRHLIPKAQELHLIKNDELERIFTIHPRTQCDFKPRRLLDKFIHGGYSELFVLLQEITIEGKGKSKDIEEFINKLELDKVMNARARVRKERLVEMIGCLLSSGEVEGEV